MEGQSKDPLLRKSQDFYKSENAEFYSQYFESGIYTPIPSFKKALQGRKTLPDILKFLPYSSLEQRQFKLPKNEKLNRVLKQQTLQRDKILSEIKKIKDIKIIRKNYFDIQNNENKSSAESNENKSGEKGKEKENSSDIFETSLSNSLINSNTTTTTKEKSIVDSNFSLLTSYKNSSDDLDSSKASDQRKTNDSNNDNENQNDPMENEHKEEEEKEEENKIVSEEKEKSPIKSMDITFFDNFEDELLNLDNEYLLEMNEAEKELKNKNNHGYQEENNKKPLPTSVHEDDDNLFFIEDLIESTSLALNSSNDAKTDDNVNNFDMDLPNITDLLKDSITMPFTTTEEKTDKSLFEKSEINNDDDQDDLLDHILNSNIIEINDSIKNTSQVIEISDSPNDHHQSHAIDISDQTNNKGKSLDSDMQTSNHQTKKGVNYIIIDDSDDNENDPPGTTNKNRKKETTKNDNEKSKVEKSKNEKSKNEKSKNEKSKNEKSKNESKNKDFSINPPFDNDTANDEILYDMDFDIDFDDISFSFDLDNMVDKAEAENKPLKSREEKKKEKPPNINPFAINKNEDKDKEKSYMGNSILKGIFNKPVMEPPDDFEDIIESTFEKSEDFHFISKDSIVSVDDDEEESLFQEEIKKFKSTKKLDKGKEKYESQEIIQTPPPFIPKYLRNTHTNTDAATTSNKPFKKSLSLNTTRLQKTNKNQGSSTKYNRTEFHELIDLNKHQPNPPNDDNKKNQNHIPVSEIPFQVQLNKKSNPLFKKSINPPLDNDFVTTATTNTHLNSLYNMNSKNNKKYIKPNSALKLKSNSKISHDDIVEDSIIQEEDSFIMYTPIFQNENNKRKLNTTRHQPSPKKPKTNLYPKPTTKTKMNSSKNEQTTTIFMDNLKNKNTKNTMPKDNSTSASTSTKKMKKTSSINALSEIKVCPLCGKSLINISNDDEITEHINACALEAFNNDDIY